MIVGVDDWAATCEVGRNGDRLLGELDAPALPVVARKGQRGLAYQVMPGWVRCAGELRPRRSQRTGGVLFGIALRTRCQCWRRCDASSRQKQFPSGQYIGAWLWHVDVETRCVRRCTSCPRQSVRSRTQNRVLAPSAGNIPGLGCKRSRFANDWFQPLWLCRKRRATGCEHGQLFDAPLAQDPLNVSNRKDVRKLREARTDLQLRTLAFVELRNLIHGLMKFPCQARNDPPLIGLILFRDWHRADCGSGEVAHGLALWYLLSLCTSTHRKPTSEGNVGRRRVVHRIGGQRCGEPVSKRKVCQRTKAFPVSAGFLSTAHKVPRHSNGAQTTTIINLLAVIGEHHVSSPKTPSSRHGNCARGLAQVWPGFPH